MGQLGTKTIDKLETYAKTHWNPATTLKFSPDMQVRIMIAEQMFQAYETGRIPKTRQPRKVVSIIAERVYRTILTNAPTDPYLAELRDAVGIREDAHGRIIPRAYGQLTNDIEAYEVFRRMWGVSAMSHHAKAVYEDAAYDLIEMGTKNSNGRDLAAGMDRLAKLHKDFQEAAEDYANTAETEFSIASDATIVRPDSENFSRAAIADFEKEFGAYIDKKGVQELIEQEDGTYAAPGDVDEGKEEDYFERAERELRERGAH